MISYIIQIIARSIFCYLIIALILGAIPVNRNFRETSDGQVAYIVSNGIHTDIVLPVKSPMMQWDLFFSQTKFKSLFTDAKYIAFGWGNREFYLHTPEWKDLTLSIAVHALFLNGEPAMHVTVIDFIPAEGKYIKKTYLSPRQIERLRQIVISSFKTDEEGYPEVINAPGYYDNDLFFEATGNFNIFRTCNVWTSECLRYAGIRCGIWTPFEFSVLYHLSRLKKK
jgi:uncharacterized protein (TIGR02117 family)